MAIWGVGVIIGPIIGPALGGWLTENFAWRWVFFINLPIGILAFYGIGRYIRKRPGARRIRFDMFGFATLAIAIGALQLFLDRGEQNDWFSSRKPGPRRWPSSSASATSSCIRCSPRPGKSFFDLRLLRNPNYVSGIFMIFLIGMVLFATRALLATMLQNLFGYPAALPDSSWPPAASAPWSRCSSSAG